MFDPKVKVMNPKRGSKLHDLSFPSLVSLNFGRAKCVCLKHMFAGETFETSLEHYLKFQPMLAPAFQRYKVRFDSFIVPEDVHWKDSISYYPQISSVFNHKPANKQPVKANINPLQLYCMVALDSVYTVGVDDTVLNPFCNSLIDDFNLPTFDNLLDLIRSQSDQALCDIANFFLYKGEPLSSPFRNITVDDLDKTVGVIANTSNPREEHVPMKTFPWLPTGKSDDLNVRVCIIRSIFLSVVCGQIGFTLLDDKTFDTSKDYIFTNRPGEEVFNNILESADVYSPLLSISYNGGENLDTSKYIDFVPFLSYQAIYREYYRNGFVDEDDNDNIGTTPYLPADLDYKDILPYIEFTHNAKFDGTSNVLNFGFFNSFSSGFWVFVNNPNNLAENWTIIHNLVGYRDVNFSNDYFTSASITAQAEQNAAIPLTSRLFAVGEGLISAASYPNPGSQVPLPGGGWTNVHTTAKVGQVGRPDPVTVVNSGTIPDLRIANVMQLIQEKALLASSGRPYEFYRLFFGHVVSDARLHRPTFLGRVSKSVSISEVTQTGASSENQPLGDFAGKGTSVGSDRLFSVTADEPSWLIVIASIVPLPSYFQGIPYELMKNDPFEYLLPDMQHVGMRSIDNAELYLDHDSAGYTPNVSFGFTDLYNEYRMSLPEIHGEFRNSMNYWHSARTFKSLPRLNPDFIRVKSTDPDYYRPFAVTGGFTSHVIMQLYFNISAYRELDYYPNYSLKYEYTIQTI